MSDSDTVIGKPFHATSFDSLPLSECEALLLKAVMKESNGEVSDAAQRLGLDSDTLQQKLQALSVEATS